MSWLTIPGLLWVSRGFSWDRGVLGVGLLLGCVFGDLLTLLFLFEHLQFVAILWRCVLRLWTLEVSSLLVFVS